MKRINPFHKNESVTLTIDGMTNEGQGVGHVHGIAFFVPDTVVGETVSAHIIKVEKQYCVAKALSIDVPSPNRALPRCEAYAFCGGCTMQHMTYAEQLVQKRAFVHDALERLGKLSQIDVCPMIGMENPWRYRNKGSFPFGMVGQSAAFGFYAKRSHRLIPLYDCPIQSDRITEIARQIAAWANRCRISIYDETTGRGSLRACVVRVTTEQKAMAIVVTKGKLAHEEELIKRLSFVDSLYHNQNDRNTNVLLSDSFRLLHGSPELDEMQNGLVFSIAPQSFLQVNSAQTERLYQIAIAFLNPKSMETVFDLYCGIGTISLQIAQRAERVIGIECVPAAIENARSNAIKNGLHNAEFICALAENALPDLIRTNIVPDAIVLDPPRKGCEPQVLDAILNSRTQRIVYVSCNPATLARDLKVLVDGGFCIKVVQPIDMFPQTAHVETVVLLSRSGN